MFLCLNKTGKIFEILKKVGQHGTTGTTIQTTILLLTIYIKTTIYITVVLCSPLLSLLSLLSHVVPKNIYQTKIKVVFYANKQKLLPM